MTLTGATTPTLVIARRNAPWQSIVPGQVTFFKTLSEIVKAHATVTPEMATRLALAFGKSAESWLGHQAAHDLWALQPRKADFGVQRLTMAV